MLDLNKNIQYIKGVGPARVKLLNKLGIYTLNDIINYYPRTYEDRSKTKKLNDVYDGEEILIIAKVMTKVVVRKVRKGLTLYKVIVADESNNCEITWYNQEYIKEKIRQGNTYKFYQNYFVQENYKTTSRLEYEKIQAIDRNENTLTILYNQQIIKLLLIFERKNFLIGDFNDFISFIENKIENNRLSL